jgi:hypothetical protein
MNGWVNEWINEWMKHLLQLGTELGGRTSTWYHGKALPLHSHIYGFRYAFWVSISPDIWMPLPILGNLWWSYLLVYAWDPDSPSRVPVGGDWLSLHQVIHLRSRTPGVEHGEESAPVAAGSFSSYRAGAWGIKGGDRFPSLAMHCKALTFVLYTRIPAWPAFPCIKPHHSNLWHTRIWSYFTVRYRSSPWSTIGKGEIAPRVTVLYTLNIPTN